MHCLVFSNNLNKINEIQTMMGEHDILVSSYMSVTETKIIVVEDGLSFEENALKKVKALSFLDHDIVMADDSGLEVMALDGEPGIFSARYGSETFDDGERNMYLLDKMSDIHFRQARFCCVIALQYPGMGMITVKGTCEGTITSESRGSNGFGYDPIFIPDGYSKTFAELGPDVKNKISHRALALDKAKKKIEQFLAQN